MPFINIEFKSRVADPDILEKKLLELGPLFIGEDHQKDTYFNVTKGRLKLREGNIENALIYYERPNSTDPKQSNILLYQHNPDPALKEILVKLHGIKVVVEKKRRIYFIGNVKFHFDHVTGLGSFIEVEAIDRNGDIGSQKLKEQCEHYAHFFGINTEDYIALSYSDMILEKELTAK